MDTSYSARREVTAFFDDRESAERAMAALADAGVSAMDIRMIAGDSDTFGQIDAEDMGFFEKLGNFFMPADDRTTYAEGLRRSGNVISVTASGEHIESALDILDVEGAVDMDDRARQWESDGWVNPAAGMASGSAMGVGDTFGATPGMTVRDPVHTDSAGSTRSDDFTALHRGVGATSATDGDSEKIDVIAEELQVGKRDVTNGRVRVRSYVVEEPVSQDVSLRTEHVEVHRTAVDHPVSGTEDMFRDRTIELDETSEEAVISKSARVVEEISVSKTVDTATQTISDKLRRTEVEIEDDRKSDTAR